MVLQQNVKSILTSYDLLFQGLYPYLHVMQTINPSYLALIFGQTRQHFIQKKNICKALFIARLS